MSNLTKAILIAAKSHDGQYDKGGNPYILHPLRLLTKALDGESRIVAVLHDVVEDSDYTLDRLRADGFTETILEALDCLTRRSNETYDEFIERIKPNPLARHVKLLDINDNRDLSRIQNPTERDFKRLRKYDKAISDLLAYEMECD
ncbi:GTP pyrophosphokinase [Paenibacillus sp. N1-5-1-14]|uniref:GTP pyrophosphokinase n=1 Tax=Paenibacillus radicibacter TaxID=2972488 RepID=UPI0021597B18|nr:GTP pyrophosphokinase [Paenibacillus radicibacter]MCR8641448.1 GTP pyrophosphokinase [Paenibacillus radicibacter]